MKTHKFFYALAATAMLGLSACSSEEPLLQGGNGEGITYSYNGSLNYAIDNNGGSLVINGAKVSTLLAQSTGVVAIDAGTVTNAYVDGASKVKVKSGATATVQAKDGSAAISAAEGAYTVYSVN